MVLTKVLLLAAFLGCAQAVLNLQRSVTLHRKGFKGNVSQTTNVSQATDAFACPCCGSEEPKPTCPCCNGVWNAEFSVGRNGAHVGKFTVEVHPEWAPKGANRFRELVGDKFFNDVRFFRVVPGFMAQFGINGDPAVQAKHRVNFQDDDFKQSNLRGYLTFANAGPNTRSTQLFINFKDNTFLDDKGFPAFARVVKGMDVVDGLYGGYGESAPAGNGPNQGMIQAQGNTYLKSDFPEMSYIESATYIPHAHDHAHEF